MERHWKSSSGNPAQATVLGDGDVALGVIHSLAMAGIGIRQFYTNHREHSHHSRFLGNKFFSPAAEDSPELLDFLLEQGVNQPGSCLIPCSDPLVLFAARHREALEENFRLVVPPYEALKQVIDKAALYRQAVKSGIPAARCWMPDSLNELKGCLDEITFPCILKPAESHRFFKVYGKKLLVITGRSELEDAFRETLEKRIFVMISEIIKGDDSSLFHYRSFMDAGGKIIAEMCTRKLRQHPAGFGVASYSCTVPIIPEIKEMTVSLLRNLGYSGFSSAEFKKDATDGLFKLVEINVRPVLPERLFPAAGVNFCRIACSANPEEVYSVIPEYEVGIYWVHNFLETVRLVYHRNLVLREFLQPYRQKKLVKCIPFFHDPLPFIFRTVGVLREMTDLIFKRRYR